jgi:dTDP-glucose 4,6-dehydratase
VAPSSGHQPHSHLIHNVSDRPGHDRRYAINIDKIREELGWRPSIELPSGLKKTVIWYLNNSEWLSAITQKPDYNAWIQHNYQSRGNIK